MEVEIIIPESLDEITLEQYQKFIKIAHANRQEDGTMNQFVTHKMIEIFCGLDLKDVAKIKYSSVVGIYDHFNELFNSKAQHKETFILDGVEYGFIPNLDEMTWGEYIDLDTTYATIEGDFSDVHKLMAILYRPVTVKTGNKYDIEEYEGYTSLEDKMKRAPLSAVLGCLGFFWTLKEECLKITLNYLKGEVEKLHPTQLELISKLNGDGMNQSMLLPKETYKDLMKLQGLTFTKYLPF